MIVLSRADIVLPGRIQSAGVLVIDGDRIVDVGADFTGERPQRSIEKDLRGHVVVPGFIDVHVHGIEGFDTLDGGHAIAAIAERLPKFGVTSFCPTTVACAPDALREVLRGVQALRHSRNHSASKPASAPKAGARVLPAHLESNFINPEFRGAQPAGCLRMPPQALRAEPREHLFDGSDIVAEIEMARGSVGIVTLAPELDGALELIRHLVSCGLRVSLGHSGATFAQSRAAIDAGARHATHLFNRMPPLDHREPGLAGAVLTSEEVAAEIICDGVHVHRDMVRMAVAAKGVTRMMGVSDGVAAAGLPEGATASLGGRTIRVRGSAAYLDDGTLAGSVATMDRAFRFLTKEAGLSLSDAAQMCATTPASELGLADTGAIVRGAIADLVVLDRDLNVRQTYVAGKLVYSAS